MKRFLLVLLFAVLFTFSSCKNEIEHWLVIQTYVNDRLPTPIYDSKKETYYLNLKVDQTITLKYFLVPNSDEEIIITTIDFNSECFELLEVEEPILIFKTKHPGVDSITLYSKNNGSGSTVELRIID